MQHAIHLVAGIVITLAGVVQVYGAILDTESVFHWRGEYPPGGVKRNTYRIISAVFGTVFLVAGVSYLVTFFTEAG